MKKYSLIILMVGVLISSIAMASTANANKVIRSTTFGGVFIPHTKIANVTLGLGLAGGTGMIIALDDTFRLSLDFTYATVAATVAGDLDPETGKLISNDGSYQTINVEASMLAVKDMGNFQPYIGIGLVIPATSLTYKNADGDTLKYSFAATTPFVTRFGYDISFTRRTTIGIFARLYAAPAATQLIDASGNKLVPSSGLLGDPEVIDWGGTTAGLTFNFRF